MHERARGAQMLGEMAALQVRMRTPHLSHGTVS